MIKTCAFIITAMVVTSVIKFSDGKTFTDSKTLSSSINESSPIIGEWKAGYFIVPGEGKVGEDGVDIPIEMAFFADGSGKYKLGPQEEQIKWEDVKEVDDYDYTYILYDSLGNPYVLKISHYNRDKLVKDTDSGSIIVFYRK